MLDAEHPENSAEFGRRSPTGKFPLLADGERSIFEATAIIEYLEVAPAPRLIPEGQSGVAVRMVDQLFDNYVMNAMQGFVDVLLGRAPESETGKGRAILDKSYAWLDANLGNEWAAGDSFTMADCAAAPALFYADWVHPIPDALGRLKAYRARLPAYPSVARAVDGARPYRDFLPGGRRIATDSGRSCQVRPSRSILGNLGLSPILSASSVSSMREPTGMSPPTIASCRAANTRSAEVLKVFN